jgi:hypothetical protein
MAIISDIARGFISSCCCEVVEAEDDKEEVE